MSYARLEHFLPFDEPVPWIRNGAYAEKALRSMPQRQVGVYLRGRSLRELSEADFAHLIGAGFIKTLDPKNAEQLQVPASKVEEARSSVVAPPEGERAWRIEATLTNRIVRDASFRGAVYSAYDNRCAVTGLKILDWKGNSEVHAAHVWAVADGGPDVVQNGIALSATMHWLFDNHLISLSEEFTLLVAEDRVPAKLRALFPSEGERIALPANSKEWPHSTYVDRHRQAFVLQNLLK